MSLEPSRSPAGAARPAGPRCAARIPAAALPARQAPQGAGPRLPSLQARPRRQCGAPGPRRGRQACEAGSSGHGPAPEQLQARLDSHGQASSSGRSQEGWQVAQLVPPAPPVRPASAREWQLLSIGALAAISLHVAVQWLLHLPFWQRLVQRFIWWKDGYSPDGAAGPPGEQSTALTLYSDNAESVEWFNMCWRKMWRVYQRGLERWLADLLQPVFDNLVAEVAVPRLVQRLRIVEFSLDHEAPTFSRMRRRSSRKDSDLNGVVDVRYTGGARMLLLIEVGQGRWRFKLPVLVSDLDLECKLWIKLRLAPMPPFIGTVALAFVGPPNIKVQLLPYNHVRLMRIPILQPFLTKLLTVDLPGLMVLPKRLEINIPPAVTAVAEAAVGHDAVMRAVASAVLQADALEHALMAALPLGPQSAAGGVSLPDSFQGELQVTLLEARDLPVWGFPWQSNPYCRLALGGQAVRSRRDDDTSHAGGHRCPVWNQEFQFLVEDPAVQVLEVHVRDSHLTGRADLGHLTLPLRSIPPDGHVSAWFPVQSWTPGVKAEGEVRLQLSYKPFVDDEGEGEAAAEREAFAMLLQEQAITDVKSAADASSRAAVAASAAAAAVAVTKAAAARAAAKAALNAKARARQKRLEAEQEGGGRRGGGGEKDAQRKKVAITAAENGSGGAAQAAAERRADEPSPLETVSLQDISPEDLFPPVRFSINERADADMPYSGPTAGGNGASSSSSGASSSGSSSSSSSSSGGSNGSEPSRQARAGEAAQARREPQDGAQQPIGEADRASSGNGASSSGNGASPGERSKAKPALQRSPTLVLEAQERPGSGSSSGGGKAARAAREQAEGELVVTATDASGRSRAPGVPSAVGEPFISIQGDQEAGAAGSKAPDSSGPEQAEPLGQPGAFRSILARLPFVGSAPQKAEVEALPELEALEQPEQQQQQQQQQEGEAGAEQQQEAGQQAREGRLAGLLARVRGWRPFGRREEQADAAQDATGKGGLQVPVSDDTIRDVVVADELQLEAIAEEVQLSWRLKEIRAEQLMQKAVARSERPWLILLSSMFTATVVLLLLVLWRLWLLEQDPGTVPEEVESLFLLLLPWRP